LVAALRSTVRRFSHPDITKPAPISGHSFSEWVGAGDHVTGT
jgi:hypothetical protein